MREVNEREHAQYSYIAVRKLNTKNVPSSLKHRLIQELEMLR